MHGSVPHDRQVAMYFDPTSGIERVEAERAAAAEEFHSTCGIFGADWFAGVSEQLWPDEKKRTAAVNAVTGAANTTSFRWHTGASEIPSRVCRRMLWSSFGWVFLFAIMRGCKAKWWLDLLRGQALLRAIEAEQKRFAEQQLGLE